MNAEVKALLDQALKTPEFRQALALTSPSAVAAKHRIKMFADLFERQGAMNRMFSTSTLPSFGTVLQLASLISMVTSFSGFLTIERAVDQPILVQYFLDLLGTNNTSRFPTVGPTQYSDDNRSMVRGKQTYTTTITSVNFTATPISVTNPIIPGTIKITLTVVDSGTGNPVTFTITDDRNGNLLIPNQYAQYIDFGTTQLIYGSYVPTFTAPTLTIAINTTNATTIQSVEYTLNQAFVEQPTYPGAGNDTRFRVSLSRTVRVETKPSTLVGELNLVDMAHASKSLGVDLASILTQKITEVYTKTINRYIAQAYITHFYDPGNLVTIDVFSPIVPGTPTTPSWYQYTPILDKLTAEMERVALQLAQQSYVGLKPTAYLVSPRMAYWMKRTKVIDPSSFVENNATYINDLIGYWNGVPVLVHTELASVFEGQYTTPGTPSYNLERAGGFAVHVRPDASLAPLLHAIFLPATATPTIGNFNNPVQQAMGIYYQVDVEPLARELVVPFVVQGLPVS